MTTHDTKDIHYSHEIQEAYDAHMRTVTSVDVHMLFRQPHGKYDEVKEAVVSLNAFSEQNSSRVAEAVCHAIPTHQGKFHSIVFKFARCLKSLDFLEDATLDVLRKLTSIWAKQSTSLLKDKKTIDVWSEFICGWNKITTPSDVDYMESSLAKAAELNRIRRDEEHENGPEELLLIKLCYVLQLQSGKDTFFLGCRTVAKLFGTNRNSANKWLNMLVATGVLKLISKGVLSKASEYLYCGPVCDEDELEKAGIQIQKMESQDGKHHQIN